MPSLFARCGSLAIMKIYYGTYMLMDSAGRRLSLSQENLTCTLWLVESHTVFLVDRMVSFWHVVVIVLLQIDPTVSAFFIFGFPAY